jgi:Uma2 family endonuclease
MVTTARPTRACGDRPTMPLDEPDILDRHAVSRHRLTLADYHRLGEAGILGVNDRVELLEGQLVDMSPIGPRHAFVVEALNEALVTAVAGRASVRPQNPIILDNRSEPQPDFAVVGRRPPGQPHAHPEPEDVFLLIEVADSSLAIDRGAKLALYARAGIREYWLVDLTTDCVFVHRDPEGEAYATVRRVEPPATLDINALPGVAIETAPIFM